MNARPEYIDRDGEVWTYQIDPITGEEGYAVPGSLGVWPIKEGRLDFEWAKIRWGLVEIHPRVCLIVTRPETKQDAPRVYGPYPEETAMGLRAAWWDEADERGERVNIEMYEYVEPGQ